MTDSSVLFVQDALSNKRIQVALLFFGATYGLSRYTGKTPRDISFELLKISTIPVAAYNLYTTYDYTKEVEGADLIRNNVHNYSNIILPSL